MLLSNTEKYMESSRVRRRIHGPLVLGSLLMLEASEAIVGYYSQQPAEAINDVANSWLLLHFTPLLKFGNPRPSAVALAFIKSYATGCHFDSHHPNE